MATKKAKLDPTDGAGIVFRPALGKAIEPMFHALDKCDRDYTNLIQFALAVTVIVESKAPQRDRIDLILDRAAELRRKCPDLTPEPGKNAYIDVVKHVKKLSAGGGKAVKETLQPGTKGRKAVGNSNLPT